MGKKLYPNREQVKVLSERASLIRAGLRRYGEQWGLAIQTPTPQKIEALADVEPVLLRRTTSGYEYLGVPSSHLIHLRFEDGVERVLCGHGKQTIKLARGVLPADIERGLTLHPKIELVETGETLYSTVPSMIGQPRCSELRKCT